MRALAICLALMSGPVLAAGSGEQLALETYRHLVGSESMLDGAIRSGDRNDYNRFIRQPAADVLKRWPALGDPSIDAYARCRFAVAEYLNYSDDQFKAGGKLPKSADSSKTYFEQKAACKKALKGKV